MKIMFGLIATIALSVGASAMPAPDNNASLETSFVALQDDAAPVEEVADAAQDAVEDAVPPTPVEPPAPAEAPTPVEPPAAAQDNVVEPPAPAEEAEVVEEIIVEETAVEPSALPVEQSAPVIEMPALEVQMIETPSVMSERIIVAQPMMMDQPVMSDCCQTCNNRRCCCPPPAPTPTTFCLVDPCGSSHQACINVPACCAGQQPNVCWRSGIFGRQIATVTWDCCGHSVKVIVTCRGKVRVRG